MDSTNDQRAISTNDLPLAIGPLSIFKAAFQRHSAVYHIIADVAKRYGIPYVHTSRSSVAMETLIDPDRSVVRWLELFPFEDARTLRSLVRRAEKCHFRAIVLTLDENAQHINSSGEDAKSAQEESFLQPDFEDLTEDFIRAGVTAIILNIGPYTPFEEFVTQLTRIRMYPRMQDSVYAGGSCFTEEEVAELVRKGIKRIFIDLPALFGLIIDGANGVSNVLEIYKRKLPEGYRFCEDLAYQ
ncbi:uncharacterized protein LOC126574229 [Anopheles aquasalis]|uniref:uncharacterized protein LOC126574229 n=1 Tax=Anopheles aquasalis TaxID=42839 RepID=UPI00215AF308|nr:uncharacterized protein LOC126574229 [Anopheles aquasalis]